MRLLTCMLIVVVLLVGAASAASPVPTSKGDKAMIFMFRGLDRLGLKGYGDCWGVGMRYYISDMNALRGGVIFGNDKYTDKSQVEGGDDYEYTESEYGVDINYERHLEAPCKSVSPYLGAGIGYFSWKSEEPYAGEAARDYDKYTQKQSGFDVHALAGFEWGFTDCMTLGGEYMLGFSSGSYKEEANYVGGDTSTLSEQDHSWMGFGTASVYLSVYW
jgi:opacity protein-like surface antigen